MASYSSDIKKQQKIFSDAEDSYKSLVASRKAASKGAQTLIKKINSALDDAEKVESKLQSELENFGGNLRMLEYDAEALVALKDLKTRVQKEDLKDLEKDAKYFDLSFKKLKGEQDPIEKATKIVVKEMRAIEGSANKKLRVDLTQWEKLLSKHQESSDAIKKLSDSFKL